MKHEGWGSIFEALALNLQPQQVSQLEAFEELIRERAIPLGMVATADEGRIRELARGTLLRRPMQPRSVVPVELHGRH